MQWNKMEIIHTGRNSITSKGTNGVEFHRSKYIKEIMMLEGGKKTTSISPLMRFLVLTTAKIKVTCRLA